MIKVSITKNNIVTNGSQFETQELADAWISEGIAANWWGLAHRWERLDIGQTVPEAALQTREVDDTLGSTYTEYEMEAEYSISQEDITAQVNAENKLQQRKMKRAFGENLIDKIASMNDAKSLTVEQVDAFMSDALMTNLREHLWAGNIDTFISKLSASDVSAFFAAEEKTQVIAECQQFLNSLNN